jgi:hypothetical protein
VDTNAVRPCGTDTKETTGAAGYGLFAGNNAIALWHLAVVFFGL